MVQKLKVQTDLYLCPIYAFAIFTLFIMIPCDQITNSKKEKFSNFLLPQSYIYIYL